MTDGSPVAKIPQHRHCSSCGKAYVGDGRYCSSECEDQDGTEAKRKLKRYAAIIVLLWAVVIVAVVVTGI